MAAVPLLLIMPSYGRLVCDRNGNSWTLHCPRLRVDERAILGAQLSRKTTGPELGGMLRTFSGDHHGPECSYKWTDHGGLGQMLKCERSQG